MMNKPVTYKIFLIAIIFLTLVNLGFAISYFIIHRQHRLEAVYPRERFMEKGSRMMERGGRFMEKEIGFDEVQMKNFQNLREEFRTQISPLHKELRTLNSSLIMEATSNKPDTLECTRISRQIGDLHTEIKIITYLHMMQVAKIATPEQMKKLDAFYLEMFSAEPGQRRNHEGGQFRHRHGQRDSSQIEN